jgi:hypothetical protein
LKKTNKPATAITIIKNGIAKAENSGMVGVVVGDCEGVDVGVAFGEFGGPKETGGVSVGVGVGDGDEIELTVDVDVGVGVIVGVFVGEDVGEDVEFATVNESICIE